MSAIWPYEGPMSSRSKRFWAFVLGYLVVPIPVLLRNSIIDGRSSGLLEKRVVGSSFSLLYFVRGQCFRRCVVDRGCPQVQVELGFPGKASLGVVRLCALKRALVIR